MIEFWQNAATCKGWRSPCEKTFQPATALSTPSASSLKRITLSFFQSSFTFKCSTPRIDLFNIDQMCCFCMPYHICWEPCCAFYCWECYIVNVYSWALRGRNSESQRRFSQYFAYWPARHAELENKLQSQHITINICIHVCTMICLK